MGLKSAREAPFHLDFQKKGHPMTAEATQTMGFQTEAKRLLHLMIHSLYSNREIFLRELISNASDAIDKHRFAVIGDAGLVTGVGDYRIRVEADSEAKTITIDDNGIGMSRDEVVDNLGTIAKSGTAAFMEQLSGDQKADSQLIGQFGVGFYSSFIVADRVVVVTRKAGEDTATQWESAGEDEFTISESSRDYAGTTITLHLKDDAEEFADSWRVRSVIKKYSDHISVPVMMPEPPAPAGDDEDAADPPAEPEWQAVNEAKALWTRSRSEISDEEYQAFYKHISHDFEDALSWSHNAVEGKLEYTSLLYIPRRAPFDLWHREGARGLKLYVQRTFIMDDAEQFLPLYLRFVKGVLDSNDLPLNVSREILQQNPSVESIKSALTKRVLDMLQKMASAESEKYQQFWDTFGEVLKEGPAEDYENKDEIASLFIFASSKNDDDEINVDLDSYIERMEKDQDKIYYCLGDTYEAALNSPHIESLKKADTEVLLLTDRIDEWLMTTLAEYNGKELVNAAKADFDDAESKPKISKDNEKLIERIASKLKDEVAEVVVSSRLVDSAARLVTAKHDPGIQMRKILESAGQKIPDSKPSLEVNLKHKLIKKLDTLEGREFTNFSKFLLDYAIIAEGGSPKDPSKYLRQLDKFLI